MFKKRILLDLVIIFLLGLIPLLWFKGDSLILGHDAGLPFDPIVHFLDRFYAWTQRFGSGTDQSSFLLGAFFIHGLEALLSWIGLSLQAQQKVQFIFWFTLPGIAMYFFAFKIWQEKRYLPVIASLIYMVNFYLIQGWFIAERTKFSIYAALPLILYFFIAYLTKKMHFLPAAILSALVLAFLNGGGSFPLYGGLLLIFFITAIYFIVILTKFEVIKRLFFYAFGVGVLYILLNSYWLINYYYYVTSFYSRDLANVGGADGVLTWATYLSRGSSFLNLLRGQGVPEWYLNDFHPYAAFIRNNSIFIVISFLFPLLALFPLAVAKKVKDKFYVYLFIFIALAGILLSAGPNSQFGFIFESLVRYMPGFAMFRSAYYKFNYATWFSYALLIGFSIDYFLTRIRTVTIRRVVIPFREIFLIAIVLGYLLYHFPVLNGSFFNYNNDPTSKISNRIEVPQYIFEFGEWINKQDQSKRYLVMPELHDSGYISYQWGYWSLAPVSSLLTRSSFVHNTALVSGDERILIKQMYDAFLKGDMESFFDFVDVFAIDTIVLQKDFDWKNIHWGTTDPERYEKILQASPRFSLVESFGNWDVYKILDKEKSLRITTSNKLNFSQVGLQNLVSFPYFNPRVPLYISQGDSDTSRSYAALASDIFLGAPCLQCDFEKTEKGFDLYNPKFLPGSFLYNLITLREERVKKNATDFASKANYLLTTADRRIVEVKWMVEFNQNIQELQNTLLRYQTTLSELNTLMAQKDWEVSEQQGELLIHEVLGHLKTQSDLVASVHNDAVVKLESRLVLATIYDMIIQMDSDLRNRLWGNQNVQEKKYIYDVPVSGEYEVYLKKNSLTASDSPTNDLQIQVKGLNTTMKPISETDEWIYFGSLDLDSNVQLSLLDTTVNNLLNQNDFVLPENVSGFSVENNTFVMTSESLNKCFSIPVKNLPFENNEKYLLSFSYKNNIDKKILAFDLDEKAHQMTSLRSKDSLMPNKRQWTTFSTTFSTLSSDLYLNFCNGFVPFGELRTDAPWLRSQIDQHGIVFPSDQSSDSTTGEVITEIKDITVHKLSSPIIVLYRRSQTVDDIDSLTNFTKKSPVDYEVNLKSVSYPVFLTLSESYGKFWKVCKKDGTCLPFDDKTHFANAGFANTWYLKEGVDADMTFYYYPQTIYIVGSIISVISFIIISTGLFIYYRRKK